MGYAIELLFDSEGENKILDLIQVLDHYKIDNKFLLENNKPHITLSVFENIVIEDIVEVIDKMKVTPFNILFNGLGNFNVSDNVIFLIPKVTHHLLDLHQDFYSRLSPNYEYWEYYKPKVWTPHCTLTMGINNSKFLQAFHLLQAKHSSFYAKVNRIGLVEFSPATVIYEKHLH
ncbi:MAG: 2'-5' RNA ligase family protein [Hyphomicrobiales bacterium]